MKPTALEAYARKWQARLVLQNWRIEWTWAPVARLNKDASVATVDWRVDAMYAAVVVATGRPDAEVLASIRHELLHLCLAPMVCHARNLTEALDSRQARKIGERAFDAADEEAVLRLDRALEDLIANGD